MLFLCYVLPRCVYKLFENAYKEQFIEFEEQQYGCRRGICTGNAMPEAVCIACEEGEGCAGQALMTVST